MGFVAYLIQGIGLGFAAAAQPGAFQTYVISQTLSNGWRRTLPAALAPLLSDGPIILLMLLLLTRLPDALRAFLHIASGAFILYLAWGAFRAWRGFDVSAPLQLQSGNRSLAKAALMNALSPGPYIFWSLVAGPILLQSWSEAPAGGLSFLAGFYSAMIVTLGAIILAFGTLRQRGPRMNRALLGISAIALTGFGLYQLWLGLARR